MATCVVTGVAGFIGSALAERLLAMGHRVRGVDCLSPSYDPLLKERNLAGLNTKAGFQFFRLDLVEAALEPVLEGADVVFHQAALAGVRGSWGDNFPNYLRNNVWATQRLLEAAVRARPGKIVLASSSSVYGSAPGLGPPGERALAPLSPYGLTKLCQEHLGKIYALNHGLPVVTLRYFTVYGPRQRPDMAIYRFMNLIMEGKTLPVFGDGQQKRDLTYVEDVVRANCLAMERAVEGRAFDIGTGQPVTLLELVEAIEAVTGKKAAIRHLAAQPGDVRETRAELEASARYLGYVPQVELRTGLGRQWEWMCERRSTRLTR